MFDVLFPDIDAKRVNNVWKDALKKSGKPEKRSRKRKEEEEEETDSDDD